MPPTACIYMVLMVPKHRVSERKLVEKRQEIALLWCSCVSVSDADVESAWEDDSIHPT